MKKKRFSVEQIVGVLKQAEVGVPVAEVIRKAGISGQAHSTTLRAGSSIRRRRSPQAWRRIICVR